ncbi:uncharacterized protein LOC122276857 [Carya illinoinensis]|uniref:uncharacterized protein LOC122276857 n=1 Tax=Carya illinoinensis TaxID=32201 RepID=UPI001C725EBA|nr:uncharacterized protein LOC122276857 [Carya illinoinensis]
MNPDQEVVLKQKIFRYEVAWGKREGCSELVQAAWKQNFFERLKITTIRKVMEVCRNKLKSWSKEAFRNHKRLLNQKREVLRQLQESDLGQHSSQIKSIQRELDGLLEEEELKWRQRAKQRWLKDGDRNTKFFYKCATQRKQVNFIKKVASEEGVLAYNQEEVAKTFQFFYQNLFTTSKPLSMEAALQSFKPSVSEEMNGLLAQEFTEKEVVTAINGMNPLGSPGPDCFLAVFYQHH